jgi:nucleotide-binding universal stress UspA family protein
MLETSDNEASPMSAGDFILVSLDGSKLSEHALPVAGWLARAYALPVRLLHVLEEGLEADVAKAESAFCDYALGLASSHGLAGATASVATGAPAHEILERSKGAAFLVIATHGRGGFKAMVTGSVADKVVRGTKVPTVMVPGVGETPPVMEGPLLVAVDGSEESERGLELAREVAAKIGTSVALVRGYMVPPAAGIEFSYYPPDMMTMLEEAAKEYLASVAKSGESTYVAYGDTAGVIIDVAEQVRAAAVVVASTGKGLAKRIALGSTTDRLIHASDRPVLVVPAGE